MAERTARSHSRSRSRSRSPAPAEDSAQPATAEEEGAAPIKTENQDVVAVSTEAGSSSTTTNSSASTDTFQAEENRPLEIYIGNLAFSTRDNDLDLLFRSECPNLIEVKVVMERNDSTRKFCVFLKKCLF